MCPRTRADQPLLLDSEPLLPELPELSLPVVAPSLLEPSLPVVAAVVSFEPDVLSLEPEPVPVPVSLLPVLSLEPVLVPSVVLELSLPVG